MRRDRLSVPVVLALLLGAAAPASARSYYSHGRGRGYGYVSSGSSPGQFYLGISGVGTGVLKQHGGVEYMASGGGMSIWAGLRLGAPLALELNYTGSFHNPATACEIGTYYDICSANYLVLDILSADLKLHLPTGSNLDPFLQAGILMAWIGREGFAPDATGAGFDLGGGVNLWFNPWWTVGLRGLYRGMKLSDYAAYTGSDTFLSVFTGELSLAVHF